MPPLVKIELKGTAYDETRTNEVLAALRAIVEEAQFSDDLGDRDTYLLNLGTYNFSPGDGSDHGSSLLVGATYRLYADSVRSLLNQFREWVGLPETQEP
jgi:hypothetical protein